jgi:glucose uptake protein GlcU
MVIQQLGFQKGKAVSLVPLYTVLSLILPALAGVILFSEWASDAFFIIIINVIAMIGVSVGAALLSLFNAKQESNRFTSSPDSIPEFIHLTNEENE